MATGSDEEAKGSVYVTVVGSRHQTSLGQAFQAAEGDDDQPSDPEEEAEWKAFRANAFASEAVSGGCQRRQA